MILSEKHQFIFIKGRKVAGTSIEASLSLLCGEHDIITPISIIDEKDRLSQGSPGAQNFGLSQEQNKQHLNSIRLSSPNDIHTIKMPKGTFYNHMSLSEVLTLYPKDTVNWTIFGIERCPYSKIISLANMLLKYKDYQKDGRPMVSQPNELKKHLQIIIENGSVMDVKNIELYKNQEGNISATILRYENLQEDYQSILSALGINSHPPLKHYKKGLTSNTLNPLDIFTREQLDFINTSFEDEFLAFSYEML